MHPLAPPVPSPLTTRKNADLQSNYFLQTGFAQYASHEVWRIFSNVLADFVQMVANIRCDAAHVFFPAVLNPVAASKIRIFL
jgi:hypothetical protein